MGRPRIKIIDDAQIEVEEKASKKIKKAKSESPNESVIPSETRNLPGSEDPSLIVQDDKIEAEDRHVVSQSGTPRDDEKKEAKKATKPGKAKPRSKKYQELTKDLDRTKIYSLTEAIDMVKKLSYSKFDATLEAHVNTAQMGLRGLVSLPFATGRKLRILAFGKGAETAGADIVGSDETIEEINKGKINFDIVVTTPEWMPKLAKVARILGPRGLMPNPKNGTITDDLKKAVEGFQAGKTEYKTESKAPVIHLALGKLNQPNEELMANIKTLYQTIGKSRVKKITLSPTMGPGIKIDLSSL